MIKGGYILQPRIIQESDISVASPCIREIWNYLLREANSKDNKYSGYEIKRGQLFRSYEEIREGTKWYVGWRKMRYNENATKNAMKFLRDTLRITTEKKPGGVLITICNYDYYQNPKNYEATIETTNEVTIDKPSTNHRQTTYNKNNKNKKKEKEERIEIHSKESSGGDKYIFIDKIINIFLDEYELFHQREYKLMTIGVERAMAGKILRQYKKEFPDDNSEQTLQGLRLFFKECVQIKDTWLRNKMSLKIIVSQFNSIINILRNGKTSYSKGATDEEIFRAVAKNFAIDYALSDKEYE